MPCVQRTPPYILLATFVAQSEYIESKQISLSLSSPIIVLSTFVIFVGVFTRTEVPCNTGEDI